MEKCAVLVLGPESVGGECLLSCILIVAQNLGLRQGQDYGLVPHLH